jgi:hypothetical protein
MTNKFGIACSLVVLWCLFKSASRANSLLQPFILHGQTPVIGELFFALAVDFFLPGLSLLASV